jgi:hypothetical protein
VASGLVFDVYAADVGLKVDVISFLSLGSYDEVTVRQRTGQNNSVGLVAQFEQGSAMGAEHVSILDESA